MIELIDLTKTVKSGDSDLTILKNVNLKIADGQFLAVTGASGSGKSTLLGLIAGLDNPSTGKILIDGTSLTELSEDRLATLRSQKIGFVFQAFHLIPSLTAFENVLISMEIAGVPDAASRARELLSDVDLLPRAHHYPSQLSGGEQQRVAIARAFSTNPAILLADEPTGNLDSKNGNHVFDLLVQMNRKRGATLILVTHERELASSADRIIELRDGEIIGDHLLASAEL